MDREVLAYMKQIVRGEFVLPDSIELHPTNGCNQNCIWCIMEEQRKNAGHLTHNQLESIAVQMHLNKVMKHIFISGGGEPLTNLHLFDSYTVDDHMYESYFELLSALGVSVGLSTNGEFIHRLIASSAGKHIDILRVSVDAGTDLQYQNLHRPYSGVTLERIVKQIEMYYKTFGKKVRISYLLHAENAEDYTQLANLFHTPEAVDAIEVKMLMNEVPLIEMNRPSMVVNAIKIKFPKEKAPPKYNYSYITSILINALGDVFPCCHYSDDTLNKLGHIDEEPIKAILKNKFEDLKAINCTSCSYLEANQLLSQFKEIGGAHFDHVKSS